MEMYQDKNDPIGRAKSDQRKAEVMDKLRDSEAFLVMVVPKDEEHFMMHLHCEDITFTPFLLETVVENCRRAYLQFTIETMMKCQEEEDAD